MLLDYSFLMLYKQQNIIFQFKSTSFCYWKPTLMFEKRRIQDRHYFRGNGGSCCRMAEDDERRHVRGKLFCSDDISNLGCSSSNMASLTGCRCSGAHAFDCSINCSLYGQRTWLEYLWERETAMKRKCRRRCHKTHYFCNATDQNVLVARLAALRYKRRQSIKWLLINLATLTIVFFDENFPTIIHVIFVSVNFLSACYYIQNLVKLWVARVRVEMERPAQRTGNCLWEKNSPQNLTRYFQVNSAGFVRQYYSYFSMLVSALRTVRSSPMGRMETAMGMEGELKLLEDTLLKVRASELKAKRQSYDPERVSQLIRVTQPVLTSEQLKIYWKDYEKALDDAKVRWSVAQTAGNQSWSSREKCDEDSMYFEVPVSPFLSKSVYQKACENDLHSSVIVASGSFYDFMKTHHRKDYCCSLKWVSNMKFWLSHKMKEVVEQFDMANSLLVRHGAAYAQIGSSSIADLQAALRMNEELFTFTPLLPFLTLTHNQSYLVWRYRVLAHGCLSSYSWRSGGDHRGNWDPETGPCDADIVLHFFCSYMDMVLPDLPFNPAKKRPFSDHYVTRCDKPLLALVEIAIVRRWVSPPHFNVFVNGKIYEVPGGSNNLFLALSYLIYCVKIYRQGKIGKVSLDQPSLNLLCVVNDANA